MLPHSITERSLLVVAPDGEDLVMHRDNEYWESTIEALRKGDDELVIQLMTPRVVVEKFTGQHGVFDISEGDVKYNGESLGDSYVTRKILRFMADGLPFEPLLKFFEKVSKNPSFRVRKDLLEFLDKGNLPITEGGCFLAYKYTKVDGYDRHTGTVKYDVGTIVSMPREKVDDDPNNTCSAGLHVASRHYFSSMQDDRFIVVQVNPEDVVSIPTDYNNSKMRVCRLLVVSEIEKPQQDNIWGSQIVEDECNYCDTCDDECPSDQKYCDDCGEFGNGD